METQHGGITDSFVMFYVKKLKDILESLWCWGWNEVRLFVQYWLRKRKWYRHKWERLNRQGSSSLGNSSAFWCGKWENLFLQNSHLRVLEPSLKGYTVQIGHAVTVGIYVLVVVINEGSCLDRVVTWGTCLFWSGKWGMKLFKQGGNLAATGTFWNGE